MKISRIDVIGQNGNDGDHYGYACFGRDWLMEHGLIDCGKAEGDRAAQGRMPGSVEGRAGTGQLDIFAAEDERPYVGGEGTGKAPGAGSGSQGKAESADGKALK